MKKQLVRISDCVHFKGYRYGGFGNNIYEDYVVGLHRGDLVSDLRGQFLRRILSGRGGDFGAVLSISLERTYVPWIWPWSVGCLADSEYSNIITAQNNPDIVCHMSPFGILASHINREFFWLGRAYSSIKSKYDPERFGYVNLLPFQCGNVVRYLVLDGNHRIAALHALGETHVLALVRPVGIRTMALSRLWPGVLFNVFTLSDARCIFNRYFLNENMPLSETVSQNLILDEEISLYD